MGEGDGNGSGLGVGAFAMLLIATNKASFAHLLLVKTKEMMGTIHAMTSANVLGMADLVHAV